MKVNMLIPVGLMIALTTTALPLLPSASAHICVGGPSLPGCDGQNCSGANHVHVNLSDGTSCQSVHPWPVPGPCPVQWTHTYGSGGSVGATSSTAAVSPGVGFVSVTDDNTADCDGNGVGGDYDGDLEKGVGGGAFGYGPFAAFCGHNEHGGNFLVVDLVASNVAFVVGADDQTGGIPDPVTGDPTCITDGVISPGTDTDDCLTGVQYNSGSVGACTGGGDGLVWVFLSGLEVVEDVVGGGGVGSSDPPTVGTITAF